MINHSVTFGICLGGDNDFYCSIRNGHLFHQQYLNVRAWLIAHSLLEHVDFVEVDAETPTQLINEIGDDVSQPLSLFGSLTSQEQIDLVETNLSLFVEAIKEDGIKAGIIKLPSIQDQLDGDRDLNYLTQNVYQLDVNWTYSLDMVYRCAPRGNILSMILADINDYSLVTSIDEDSAFYKKTQIQVGVIQDFYSLVKFSVESTEVGVIKDNRYMFIGDLSWETRNQPYIADKGYKLDIDVCRHLGVDRIYIYKWRYFRYFYGGNAAATDELVAHLNQHETWEMSMFGYAFYRKLAELMLYSVIDRLIVLS